MLTTDGVAGCACHCQASTRLLKGRLIYSSCIKSCTIPVTLKLQPTAETRPEEIDQTHLAMQSPK